MKKTGSVFLLIILSVGSFLYGGVLNRTERVVSAEDKTEESYGARADVRWEYCAVSKAGYAGSSRGGTYWISYFKETGAEIVELEEKVSEQQGGSLAKAIARLGEEGWEMVGQSDLPLKNGRLEAIFFKRQKP